MEPAIAPAHTRLDTLAQLRKVADPAPEKESNQGSILAKRARAKLITNTLVLRLVDVKDSPLNKAYWNTFHCSTTLEQRGKTIKTKYCKNRWCMVCNRIRTATLMKGYEPALKALQEPQFVTLTFPNVEGTCLRQEIEGMYSNFKKLNDRLKKRGVKLKGIRKLECTHNPRTGQFNPHYHFLIEGREQARALVQEWLKEYPNANLEAQYVEPANENSMMELMKYFTKILPTKGSRVDGKVHINPRALDTMFQAMQGLRVFQPLGIKKQVSEEIQQLEKKEYDVIEKEYSIWIWDQGCADWLDFITFDSLSKYEPEPITMQFIAIIQDRQIKSKPG
jgi:hypothetical protein